MIVVDRDGYYYSNTAAHFSLYVLMRLPHALVSSLIPSLSFTGQASVVKTT